MAQAFLQRARQEAEKGLKKLSNAAEKQAEKMRTYEQERKAERKLQQA